MIQASHVHHGYVIKMLLNTIYLIILAISFLCSLVSFRLHYPPHLKILSMFIGFSLLTELFASFLPAFTGNNNNMPVYNIYRLPEFFVITWYFKQLIPAKWVQHAIRIGWLIYPLFWAWYLFIHSNLYVWSGVLANIIGLSGIALSVLFLYNLYKSEEFIVVKTNAEFWVAVGILFFEATSMPTLGVLLYLTQTDIEQAEQLSMALPIFNIIMYLIFAYAFLCRSMKSHG